MEIPLPEATQWEIVHEVAIVIQPAFQELLRQAAQGDVVNNDDTSVPVLALRRERADGRTASLRQGSCRRSMDARSHSTSRDATMRAKT